MEKLERIFEEKSLDCIHENILKHDRPLDGHEEKNHNEVESVNNEMATLVMNKLQLNSSSKSPREAMDSTYEFVVNDKRFGNFETEFLLPEKLKDPEEVNEAFSLSSFNDHVTNEYFFNTVGADVPEGNDRFKSNGMQSSLLAFDGNETFAKNTSFSALTYDANLDGAITYEESHRNLWLDHNFNPALNETCSNSQLPKNGNYFQNNYKNDFDYTFLEDCFRSPVDNIDPTIKNEKMDNCSQFGKSNMEINIMGSHYSEQGCLRGSNSYSEESSSTYFDVKEKSSVNFKEEFFSTSCDVKEKNSETIIEEYDETLDPEMEEAMQRYMKITNILTSSESTEKNRHKKIVRRKNNSFAFLRPALKKRFLVPPLSPAEQPMISMKSVHYKWPDKSREAQPSKTETIHFAMYAAIKKKYLKESQKVLPVFRKYKETQNSKEGKLRRCPPVKQALKVNQDPPCPIVDVWSSVSVKDKMVSPHFEKNLLASKEETSKTVYSVGDTGCKIAIPSSVSVDVGSFASDKFQANPEISIITPVSEANQPDYLIESTINSINGKNANMIGKNDPLKGGKIGKKANLLKIRRKSVLNTKNVVKIQIYTRSPKRMVVTRVKEPNATDDSDDTTSGFQLIKSILNRLDDLSSDLVKQICLPLKALQRGILTDSEINCIVRQGNLLKTLSELTNNHKSCSLNGCSMCEVISAKKAELRKLMNWSHHTEPECQYEARKEGLKRKIANQNASEKYDLSFWRKSKDFDHGGDPRCNSERGNNFPGETKPRTKSGPNFINNLDSNAESSKTSLMKDGELDPQPGEKLIVDSNIEFHLERLDIGKFSLMSSEIDDVMKVFFNFESVIYEIDLRNSNVQPVTLAVIRISCKDIIGVNLINNVVTIEFKTIPVLCLYDSEKHDVAMEIVVKMNQTSLLTSLKKQLNIYFLHKLFVKQNIEFALKNFVQHSWPQAKLTFNTEDDILQKSYYDGKYLLYDQREKRQKHLESLLREIEQFISAKGTGQKEYQFCCGCVNGCRSPLDCWCCRQGNPCLNCCCLSCTNPLNVLYLALVDVQEAKLDVCLMQNIYDLQDMKLKDILHQEHILSCCGASMATKQLIPNIKKCNGCKTPLSFSWCTQVVFHKEDEQRNHCILCMQCQPLMYLHCCNCSTCTLASTTGKCTRCM